MVTSTDFGLLYYHILSLHQHYNMNIRILYNSLVGFPSVKTWQPTKNMGWECSISTKSSPGPSFNASSNAQALVGMAPGFKSCGDSASRRTGNQHVWGCFPSNYFFLPTIHGNISVILDCPEELTRNFPPLILDRCFAMWLDFAWKCRSLIFPKTGPGGQFCGSENNICLSSMLVRDAHSRK